MAKSVKKKNIVWHQTQVTRAARAKRFGCKGAVLWFTGLSGSGKSTLANEVEKELFRRGMHSYILDGDNVRHGLNKDLGFSATDRKENIRRVAEVAKLFADAGVIVLTAFISPFRKERDFARSLLKRGEFIEVYVRCGLAACEARDPKGLYKKARRGEIKDFTGISSPYEAPRKAELIIYNEKGTPRDNAARIIRYLEKKKLI